MARQLIDSRVPIDLTSKSKSKSFSKVSDLNKKPAIGFGYIYIIEHIAQGDKGIIKNGYYVGLTTQTVNERWQQHLLAAKSLKWKPEGRPLYAAIATALGKTQQHESTLFQSYFTLVGAEEADLIELGLREEEYIAKFLKGQKPKELSIAYGRDLVNLSGYNGTFGGDNEPLARKISQTELIMAAYYHYQRGRRAWKTKDKEDDIKNKAKDIRMLLEEVKELKKNYRSLKSIPTIPTIERVLLRFLEKASGDMTVGDFISLALKGPGVKIGKLDEKILLQNIFNFSEGNIGLNQKFKIITEAVKTGYYTIENISELRDLLFEMYSLEVLNAQLGNLKSQLKKKREKLVENKVIEDATRASIGKAIIELTRQVKEKQQQIEAEYERIKPAAKNKKETKNK